MAYWLNNSSRVNGTIEVSIDVQLKESLEEGKRCLNIEFIYSNILPFLKLVKGMHEMTKGFLKVQDVLENYRTAIYEKDVEKFLSMYAPNVHIYDCWGNWESKGISSWKENVVDWFNGLSEDGILLNVEFNDLVVEEDSDLAFVHCAVTFAAYQEDSGEKLRQITNRFTYGLKKVNGSWVIAHEHSSLPISIETGKGIFNLR